MKPLKGPRLELHLETKPTVSVFQYRLVLPLAPKDPRRTNGAREVTHELESYAMERWAFEERNSLSKHITIARRDSFQLGGLPIYLITVGIPRRIHRKGEERTMVERMRALLHDLKPSGNPALERERRQLLSLGRKFTAGKALEG